MKCIRCNNDCTFRERSNKTCPKCQGAFAFEPRTGDMFTDVAFAKALEKASGNGGVWFYPEHLYYELARMIYKKDKRVNVIGTMVAFGIPSGLFSGIIAAILFGSRGLFVGAGIGATAAIFGWFYHHTTLIKFKRATFDTMWQRWLDIHGKPHGLLEPKAAHHGSKKLSSPSEAQPFGQEMLNYSFDRAVICDNPRTVDMLLANRFHFEHNCAVLTIGGYPQDSFDTVKAMLKNNPKLQVFVLHDATLNGCMMAYQLAHESDWFKNHGRVIDVGLRPAQAKRFKGLLMEAPTITPHDTHLLQPNELDWLRKYKLELAVIPPAKLMKLLYDAFHRYQDMRDSGDVIYMGYADNSSSTGGSMGEVDGFG